MNSSAITVTTTATLLMAATQTATRHIYINPGANDTYIGGSNVTSTDGVVLPKNAVAEIVLPPLNALYGITASGSHTIHVLQPSGDF